MGKMAKRNRIVMHSDHRFVSRVDQFEIFCQSDVCLNFEARGRFMQKTIYRKKNLKRNKPQQR